VGRDLSPLILGEVDPTSINDPVYFMTDDDASRGVDMKKRDGTGYMPVVEPNSVETVIARLDDGHLWKFSRYFDNPQYWSSPGTPGSEADDAEDVLQVQLEPDPAPSPPEPEPTWVVRPFAMTAKNWPAQDEFEMYDLDQDPKELTNLYGKQEYETQQGMLVQLLADQRRQKRLSPCSGLVSGQYCNPWEGCSRPGVCG
jgi:choline-sulfatase